MEHTPQRQQICCVSRLYFGYFDLFCQRVAPSQWFEHLHGISQRFRVRVHSNRSPTSTNTIPISVLLCEIVSPFSQDHDTDTNMRLLGVHNTHPEVDCEADAKAASWTTPKHTQMLCSLHGNIVQCAWMQKVSLGSCPSQALFQFFTDLATCVR